MDKDMAWLELAEEAGRLFSTCTRRQYGALIIGEGGRLVGMGYNGSAPGLKHCNEGGCPRALQDSVPHGSSYDNCISIHAEANAIMYSDISLRKGATLIVNGPPCYSCAKLICSSGIKKVIGYHDPAYENIRQVIDIFFEAGIEFILKIKDKR